MKTAVAVLTVTMLSARPLRAEVPAVPAAAPVAPQRTGPDPCLENQGLNVDGFRIHVDSERELPPYLRQRPADRDDYYPNGRYGYPQYGPDRRNEPEYELIRIGMGFKFEGCAVNDGSYFGVAAQPRAVRTYKGDQRYDLVIVTEFQGERSSLALVTVGKDGRPFVAARLKDADTRDLETPGKRTKLGEASIANWYTSAHSPETQPLKGRVSIVSPKARK